MGRALPADMYDADALEAINSEQLATPTDRLLLRGTVGKRRPSSPSLASHGLHGYPRVVAHVPAPVARGARPRLPASRAARTLQMRVPSSVRSQMFAVTVVIPTLVGIAVGLAAML